MPICAPGLCRSACVAGPQAGQLECAWAHSVSVETGSHCQSPLPAATHDRQRAGWVAQGGGKHVCNWLLQIGIGLTCQLIGVLMVCKPGSLLSAFPQKPSPTKMWYPTWHIGFLPKLSHCHTKHSTPCAWLCWL